MNTPDITQAQAAAFAAALAGYAAGMRGIDFAALVILCAVALVSDAMIRRGRASIVEASQYASGEYSEDEGA